MKTSEWQPDLQNDAGLRWQAADLNGDFALGSFSLHGRLLEAPLTNGVLFLRHLESGEERWFAAQVCIQTGELSTRLIGHGSVENSIFSFSLDIELLANLTAARLSFNWSVDRQLKGWEVSLACQGGFTQPWTVHMYPWEEDGKFIQQAPLTYIGVPAVLLYRDDFSIGQLFGIDPASDYLNPLTWTGTIGLHFTDGYILPQFRACAGDIQAGIAYHLPLQLITNDTGTMVKLVNGLVKDWITLNHYHPEKLKVRSPEEALKIFIEGRRRTSSWNPEVGYRLEVGDPNSSFVYMGEQPLSAYFEYRLFEITADPIWRQRSFEQLDFVLKSQDKELTSRHFGVFHSAYDLRKNAFDSDDRGRNTGYKPDINAYMARYLLQTWQRVKQFENLDRQDWYQSAISAADWVMRQRNPDGGLPQKVDILSGAKSISVVSGRALPAFPVIARITGQPRYQDFSASLEHYLLNCAEGHLCFTGHHPDLPPEEIEEASIYGAVEYWLDVYENDGRVEALDHALADTLISLLWWCPKQLAWVKNPTQCASAEQKHFLQYSIYCYQNRKVECIHRLARMTGDPFWQDLFERLIQGVFWTQVTEGDQMGATHERIADPWLQRRDDGHDADFNSLGTIYIGEQSLDTMLQLLEIGYRPD